MFSSRGALGGYVMRRSAHFVVWAEAGQDVHAAGHTLPWAQITSMWEGPRGAAISDDEQWCIVIGLGFVAFPSAAALRCASTGGIPATNVGNFICR